MNGENQRSRVYVSLAGNIGVGKSTAVALLADAFGWQPYFEFVADQPYLDDYYVDPKRWGFHSQIWFLSQRFEQQQEIADTPISVVQDRSMYEDYEVFVKSLLEQGILSHRDFRTYRRLYQALLDVATPPTLMIYHACVDPDTATAYCQTCPSIRAEYSGELPRTPQPPLRGLVQALRHVSDAVDHDRRPRSGRQCRPSW